MSAAGFLQGLQTFDKDTITEEMVELLAPYLTMEDYTFEGAKKVSLNDTFVCTNKADAFFGLYIYSFIWSRNVYTTSLQLKSATYKFTKTITSKQALIKSD